MNKFFAGVEAGRKNIGFGMLLFLMLGVAAGIPLTVDFLGGSMLSEGQYQTWKVLHGYGVFLAFVNFFFGFAIDRVRLNQIQKEVSSWAFLIAGLFGGIVRPVLYLASIPGGTGGNMVNLVETLGFVLGTFFFVRGQMRVSRSQQVEKHSATVAKAIKPEY